MIFVILGTQKFQLTRLLKLLDEYVQKGLINDEIFAQIGNTKYVPKYFESKSFLEKEEFENCINKASLIITHSGVGSIVTSIGANKPVIVFPRLKKYKEHVDNHQLDIANAFSKKGYVLCCYEKDNLLDMILQARTMEFKQYVSQRERIVNLIDTFIDNENNVSNQSMGDETLSNIMQTMSAPAVEFRDVEQVHERVLTGGKVSQINEMILTEDRNSLISEMLPEEDNSSLISEMALEEDNSYLINEMVTNEENALIRENINEV